MIKLDGTDFANAIINDLMKKCADDTRNVIFRVCDIAPEPHLPVVMGAGCAVIAAMAMHMDPAPTRAGPKKDIMLLAGLILGRMGAGEGCVDEALKDFELLKAARRTAGDAEI